MKSREASWAAGFETATCPIRGLKFSIKKENQMSKCSPCLSRSSVKGASSSVQHITPCKVGQVHREARAKKSHQVPQIKHRRKRMHQ
jgi:hypothetical protein